MNRDEILRSFDPDSNGLGKNSENLFGLPFTVADSKVVVVPVPWEVTVSYGAGTAGGPEAIRKASVQLDLYDENAADAWKSGIAITDPVPGLSETSFSMRKLAEDHIRQLEKDGDGLPGNMIQVNQACCEMVIAVKKTCLDYLSQGKLVAVLGGDHSSPLGLIQALAEVHDEFGILQIDAHADLRESYEGFFFSHASIMYNALKINAVKALVQVGIRDQAHSEIEKVKLASGRIYQFTFAKISESGFGGLTWEEQSKQIIERLPEKVYLSFDIDGLDPSLCPNTGTPVPGGLSYQQTVFLVRKLVDSGRALIGMDLCEVSPGESEWDANTGARILYAMSNQMAKSNQKN